MKRILLVAILFATTTVGHAEPTPVVKYLMDEPVTLFDLGMLRLDRLFDDFKVKDAKSVFVSVGYKWKENRISIFAFVDTNKAESFFPPRRHCKEIIGRIKETLDVSSISGQTDSWFH